MNLAEWLENWLTLYVEPSNLAPRTKACYHRAVKAVPASIGAVNMADLTALQLLPWILEVAREHPRAAQLDRVMLSRALKVGGKLGLCAQGIVDPDTLPKPPHQPKKALILTGEELNRYMIAASSTECAPVLMLCCCGLRRGEARGVTWDAVDLAAGTVTVKGQRQGNDLVALKTEHSMRQLAMPDIMKDVIEHWPKSISSPWVCDVTEKRLYTVHKRILAEEHLPPVTLHGLRHSFATAATVAGVPIKQLQGALGHAHYAITADLYADHLPPLSLVPNQVYLTS